MAQVARLALVEGRVQGVGFRHFTKLEARARGLRGWVRNRDDGAVEVWVEGESTEVEAMLAWLHHGSPSASVERVSIEEVELAGHERFAVRFD